jgi:hypothetical protein
MKNKIVGLVLSVAIAAAPVSASANEDLARALALLIFGAAIAEAVNNPQPQPHPQPQPQQRPSREDPTRVCSVRLEYHTHYVERHHLNCAGEIVWVDSVPRNR